MERYLVPVTPSPSKFKPILRPRWKRRLIELDGRFDSKYRHLFSRLLTESYSEILSFAHSYHIRGAPCQTHINQITSAADINQQMPLRKQGISALDFDSKGIYLASVTKSGCLTVHDVETLQSLSMEHPSSLIEDDEGKHLLHLSTCQQLDVVRWNLANQDEVACTSMKSYEVLVFDIGYMSTEPTEMLRKRPTLTIHGRGVHNGLSDIAFISSDESRLLASDTSGVISVWDRRMSTLPCLELTTNSNGALNTVQINVENQVLFGAGKHGIIYMWDLRGGRTSAAFQSHKETYHPPLTSVKLATALEEIRPLKAQSDIFPKEIHSIDLDPSCPYQLAFHLDDGWSGVLDIHKFQVTHIHCPPPAWLNGSDNLANFSYLRKPSWLPAHSVYAVGSSCDNGIHLLDFYPGPTSPCHVDYNEGTQRQNSKNRFLPLSESVTACASHPLNATIIAGTTKSSLLLVSQRFRSHKGEDLDHHDVEDCQNWR